MSSDNLTRGASEVPRIGMFVDGNVGKQALEFVIEEAVERLQLVCTMEKNAAWQMAQDRKLPILLWSELKDSLERGDSPLASLTTSFLAWWPKIIPGKILEAWGGMVVNFHPSLLPYNRGKHYNFWTIVEGTPFGVTLHEVDRGIDTGPILFQKPIEKSWEDTGGSLYQKAQAAMVQLFRESFWDIVEGRHSRRVQLPDQGSFHRSEELEPASKIVLDQSYSARDLLNRLRARSFEGMPSCTFEDEGEEFEVRVEIRKKKP